MYPYFYLSHYEILSPCTDKELGNSSVRHWLCRRQVMSWCEAQAQSRAGPSLPGRHHLLAACSLKSCSTGADSRTPKPTFMNHYQLSLHRQLFARSNWEQRGRWLIWALLLDLFGAPGARGMGFDCANHVTYAVLLFNHSWRSLARASAKMMFTSSW